MNTRPEIRAAAFDLDGTLVDSLADLAAAANEARRRGQTRTPRPHCRPGRPSP